MITRFVAGQRDFKQLRLGSNVYYIPRTWGIKRCCDPSVRLSVCLSHAPSSRRRISELWLLQNTNRKPHAGLQPEVEPTGQRGRIRTPEVPEKGEAYRFAGIEATPNCNNQSSWLAGVNDVSRKCTETSRRSNGLQTRPAISPVSLLVIFCTLFT